MSPAAAPAYSVRQKQFFTLLMASQYWSLEQMRQFQRQQLTALLHHARDNVPFYRTRLDVVLRDGFVDWDRWRELPIVTRGDLIERRDEMQSRSMPPGHGQIGNYSTSGSTGAPVTTTHNGTATLAANATLLRQHVWHDLDWRRNVLQYVGIDPAVDAPPGGGASRIWGPGWEPGATGREFDLNVHSSPPEVFEFMERMDIAYFRGGGTDLRRLAYEAIRLKSRIRLEGAMARSAVISADAEQLVKEAFGAKIVAYYSSKEGHKMAHRCASSHNYHVASETVLLEVLRGDGTPCAIGETGRVVITPLFSVAQPLIRYDQGDLATVGEPCQCGRSLPVLSNIVGRSKHLFLLPDGRRVLPIIPAEALMGLRAANYQIAQIAETVIEVRYVPRDPLAVGDEATLAAAIIAETDTGVEVRFKRITSFETPPGRKHLEYVSELNGPN